MILTTTEQIPGKKIEIMGVVLGNRLVSFMSKTEATKALAKIEEEAKGMGADAVVALKPYTTSNGSTCFIGTAVKFV